MDPHHRGMAFRTTLLERLEQIRGNVEIADAAAICHFPVGHDAFRDIRVPPVHDRLAIDVTREVIAGRVIRRVRTDIQPLRARRIHLWRRTRRRLLRLHADTDRRGQPYSRERGHHLSPHVCLVPCALCLLPSTFYLLPSAVPWPMFYHGSGVPFASFGPLVAGSVDPATSSREIRCFSSH